MTVKFCPSCSSILEIITLTVDGEELEFWSCPEGDWLDPVHVEKAATPESEEK